MYIYSCISPYQSNWQQLDINPCSYQCTWMQLNPVLGLTNPLGRRLISAHVQEPAITSTLDFTLLGRAFLTPKGCYCLAYHFL